MVHFDYEAICGTQPLPVQYYAGKDTISLLSIGARVCVSRHLSRQSGAETGRRAGRPGHCAI